MKFIPEDIKSIDVKTAMALIGVKSQTTLKKYMDVDKTLPYRQVGKFRRFLPEDIRAYWQNTASKGHSNTHQFTPKS